jgi:hypothetical protein
MWRRWDLAIRRISCSSNTDTQSACFFLTALLIPHIALPLAPAADTAPGIQEVTVIAPKPPTAEQIAGDNIPAFVRSHGKPGQRTGQLGRWNRGVCPMTLGLSQDFNDYVSARVQAIATAVQGHIPHQALPTCTPNVYIVFTTEPQRLLDDAAARKPELLGFYYLAEIKRVKMVDRPIQAWYVTGTEGAGPGVYIDSIWSTLPPGSVGSRLSTGLKSYILSALVVIDTSKVVGYTIGSISDYIAMVTLQQTRLIEGCGELPSILDLMASACGSERPDSITAGDLAYLRALYTIGIAREIRQQRAAIAGVMYREFVGK